MAPMLYAAPDGSQTGEDTAWESTSPGVSELVLEVVDLEASERFYADVLGLPVVERWPDREAIWVMAGERTRIGLWRPQVGLFGGRGGIHVHFAMHIAAERYDAAVGAPARPGPGGRRARVPRLRRQPRGLRRRPRRQRRRAVDLGRRAAPHLRRMTTAQRVVWPRGERGGSWAELLQIGVVSARRRAPTMAACSNQSELDPETDANLDWFGDRAGTGRNRRPATAAGRRGQPLSDRPRPACWRGCTASIGACTRRWRQNCSPRRGTSWPRVLAAGDGALLSHGTAAWRWRRPVPR